MHVRGENSSDNATSTESDFDHPAIDARRFEDLRRAIFRSGSNVVEDAVGHGRDCDVHDPGVAAWWNRSACRSGKNRVVPARRLAFRGPRTDRVPTGGRIKRLLLDRTLKMAVRPVRPGAGAGSIRHCPSVRPCIRNRARVRGDRTHRRPRDLLDARSCRKPVTSAARRAIDVGRARTRWPSMPVMAPSEGVRLGRRNRIGRKRGIRRQADEPRVGLSGRSPSAARLRVGTSY